MFHTIIRSATAVLAAAIVLGSADAARAGASHETYVEAYEGSFHVSAEENPCGSWAATFAEVRSGSATLVAPPGGREDGEIHVNGMVEGSIELAPDDASLPTYTGEYREKFTGVLTGLDPDEGDTARVSQFRLRAPMTGTDGSRLVLVISGKVTVNGRDGLVVSRDTMSCE